MEHTAGAQGSPDIGLEEAPYAVSGIILERKGENRRLDTLTSPLDGRILASGVAYGKCSMNIMMELRTGLGVRYSC
jgi:hypothetical protein